MPNAELTLIGGGGELPQLRQQIAESGLGGHISLTGPLPHTLAQERLRQASLYLFPSRFETFGVAPLEALAAGLPVIASDIPALRESLGDAALLIDPEDEAAWKEAIIRLLRNAGERLQWAERGPKRASQLAWGKQSALYETYLLEAANGSTSSSGTELQPAARRKCRPRPPLPAKYSVRKLRRSPEATRDHDPACQPERGHAQPVGRGQHPGPVHRKAIRNSELVTRSNSTTGNSARNSPAEGR